MKQITSDIHKTGGSRSVILKISSKHSNRAQYTRNNAESKFGDEANRAKLNLLSAVKIDSGKINHNCFDECLCNLCTFPYLRYDNYKTPFDRLIDISSSTGRIDGHEKQLLSKKERFNIRVKAFNFLSSYWTETSDNSKSPESLLRSTTPLHDIFEAQELKIFDICECTKPSPKFQEDIQKNLNPSKKSAKAREDPKECYSDNSTKEKKKALKPKRRDSKPNRKSNSDRKHIRQTQLTLKSNSYSENSSNVFIEGLNCILKDTKRQASSSSKNVADSNEFLKPAPKPSVDRVKVRNSQKRKKNLSISYKPSYMLEMIKNLEELSTELESANTIQ